MKIKRYMADSMRAALAQVRAEQGPNAVILSSRRVEEGIEVIAAVDYDETLFADATLKRAPAAAPDIIVPTAPLLAPVQTAELPAAPAALAVPVAPVARPAATAARVAPAVHPAVTDVPRVGAAVATPAASPASAVDRGYLAMRREIKELRELLSDELKHMTWNDKRLREPLQARVLEQLTAMDIAPDIALSLASQMPRRTTLKNPAHLPLALLIRQLRVVDNLSPVNGGVFALVGPTGAGKTTTIAKLAARWSMQHGSQDLALVSTDGYRIGAREQLMTYARIIGAPMHTANGGKELARVLDRLKSKKLVLIDTEAWARATTVSPSSWRRSNWEQLVPECCWRCRRMARRTRSMKSSNPLPASPLPPAS